MNSEDIICKYIGHIRKVSECDDEEIRSVLDRLIENDQEMFEILEKFLSKMDRVIPIEIDIAEKDKGEINDRKGYSEEEDIIGIFYEFGDIDDAIPMEDILCQLEEIGYRHPGKIIGKLLDNIIYIDDIEDDGSVYIALTEHGEELWKKRYPDK